MTPLTPEARAAWEAVRRLANIEDDLANGSPRWLDLAKAADALLSADAGREREHRADCRWERTTIAECEYRETHHFCPHPEHACTCKGAAGEAEAFDPMRTVLPPANKTPCPVCGGHGANPASDNVNWLPCLQCKGTGKAFPDGWNAPAPAGRDEELDRLLERLFLGAFAAGRARGHMITATEAAVEEGPLNQRDAILALVAQRVAEAEQKHEEAVEDAWSIVASVFPWSGQSAEWRARADRFRHVHILPREPSANKRAAQPGEVGK